jgi:hypothetical protein
VNAEEKIAALEERIGRLEALVAKVIRIASANPFARSYLKKVMED